MLTGVNAGQVVGRPVKHGVLRPMLESVVAFVFRVPYAAPPTFVHVAPPSELSSMTPPSQPVSNAKRCEKPMTRGSVGLTFRAGDVRYWSSMSRGFVSSW